MSSRVEVVGADRLRRTMGQAGRRLAAIATVNRAVAGDIASAADPPRLTGRLASSLRPTGTATEAAVSSTLVYAPVIEFGSRRRNIAPTRFLSSAAERQRSNSERRYRDHCRDSIANIKGA